jgi:hypothetical protein
MEDCFYTLYLSAGFATAVSRVARISSHAPTSEPHFCKAHWHSSAAQKSKYFAINIVKPQFIYTLRICLLITSMTLFHIRKLSVASTLFNNNLLLG